MTYGDCRRNAKNFCFWIYLHTDGYHGSRTSARLRRYIVCYSFNNISAVKEDLKYPVAGAGALPCDRCCRSNSPCGHSGGNVCCECNIDYISTTNLRLWRWHYSRPWIHGDYNNNIIANTTTTADPGAESVGHCLGDRARITQCIVQCRRGDICKDCPIGRCSCNATGSHG